MRVQFNARTYVVEPVYRDDGLGLWDFGDQAQPQDDVVEMVVDAARLDRRDNADNPDRRREEAEPAPDATARARERSPDERGPVLATYPEWDCDAETERPDWTTVRAAPVWLGDAGSIDTALDNIPAVRSAFAAWCAAPRSGVTSGSNGAVTAPSSISTPPWMRRSRFAPTICPMSACSGPWQRRNRDLTVTILLDVSRVYARPGADVGRFRARR